MYIYIRYITYYGIRLPSKPRDQDKSDCINGDFISDKNEEARN